MPTPQYPAQPAIAPPARVTKPYLSSRRSVRVSTLGLTPCCRQPRRAEPFGQLTAREREIL